MYSPPYNQIEDRAELVAFMRANSFAVLVTGTGGALHASHLPVLVHNEGDRLSLDMHMARANPQWREFFDEDVLVVFAGPHSYISPRWYEQAPRVPTWNYAAVHAYGIPRMITEKTEKHASQRRLVAAMDPQWLAKFDALPAEYMSSMLEGIVNFEIPVTRIEARWKLSQNRGRREQDLIVAELEKSTDSVDRALAALTRRHFVEE